MPYFKENKLLLIHIPKTGGTSIEKYFSQKYNIKLGPENLYFSYYEKTISDEITKYRKKWKQVLIKRKRKDTENITTKKIDMAKIDKVK